MNSTSMNRRPHANLMRLLVVGSALTVVTSCSKDQGPASNAAAARVASPSAFTQRSSAVVEDLPAHPTPSPPPTEAGASGEEAVAVAVLTDADPTSGGVPLTVKFHADVTGGPPTLHYTWDFGDRSAPAHELDAEHTYTASGQYTATFTATGPGVNEKDDVDIEVTDEGFDLDINADPDIGPAPLTVELSAVLDDEVPQPLSFQWDFGDGSRDVSNPTSHTYRSPGQYTATLTVTNGVGQSARHDVEIQVDPRTEEDE